MNFLNQTLDSLEDQIVELRRERNALRAENVGLVDDMNLLRDNNTALRARVDAAAEMIERTDKMKAAAPDLLEALIELAACGAEAWGEDRPCVKWAHAAIAKATGDQP